MKMARKQCRVWWPRQLSDYKPSSNLLLFGWCMHSFNSLDIVLAHATSTLEILVNRQQHDIQEILSHADAKMPVALQESSTFSVLGICVLQNSILNTKTMSNQYIDSSSKSRKGKMQCIEVEGNAALGSIFNDHMHNSSDQKLRTERSPFECAGRYTCGCEKLDPSMDTQRQDLIRCGNWIQLFSRLQGSSCKEARWIPEFDHIHENGVMLSISGFHLVIYDLPAFSKHHYTLSSGSYSKKAASTPFRNPSWANHFQKPPFTDLEAVVSALNCSDAAKQLLQRRLFEKIPTTHLSLCWLTPKLWYMLAISLASISSVIYIIFQLFYTVLNLKLHKLATIIFKVVFSHTWKHVHIRSCQFLYWPIFLGSGFRSHSNAEFAHRDALRKHSMWSAVAVDVLLGAVFGLAILVNIEFIGYWINFVAHNITENVLRSGCVWLMGVPAGFKLNTELAEFFGMISLDAIQTFSTLWLFMASFLHHFLGGFALSGILFGLTVPAALLIDMLRLVTLHVSTLHWLISFIYSQQIQASASLWRLFRGRKWNPLRQRLDSYDDYSVEQHVVGSLLFTPFLLLLPTTSIFYIFFTLLSTTLILIRFSIEITISILHATPYAEILLWLARRRRFPSGIWFDIISGANSFSSDERRFNGIQETALSILHSKYATLGQIVFPCYARVFGNISTTFSRRLASGILSGQRIPSCLDTYIPSTLPWMHISFREYWRLCYCSIVGCSLS
ncbi:uncharacterized protein LOC110103004 isoform X2 [Dendrobium catenatum]|uniref:uncharacterized protein LOC110103004 isoform X2 n=1 Tax=Dendrobium catenatum TaxID=906689 RepID=UPI0009F42E6E|nr:uncharacterized protein LOC110103004 isoform X2 [Dendrobium catenatum]